MKRLIDYFRKSSHMHEWEMVKQVDIYDYRISEKVPAEIGWLYVCKACKECKIIKDY